MKVSIVTPSYNQGKFLERTIKSVLSQQGDFELEYIIVDGGSTDNSLEIIQEYQQKIENKKYSIRCRGIKLMWWSKKIKNQPRAINQGLKRATGEIVAFLNSDDIYLPGTLSRVTQIFKQHPQIKWLTGYCRIINEEDKEIQKWIKGYKNFWLNRYTYNRFLVLNCICQPATFWRRSILKEVGFLNEKLNYAIDYDYWLRISKKYQPAILKKELAGFRIHESSKGKTKYCDQFNEELQVLRRYIRKKNFIYLHTLHNFLITSVYRLIK